MPNIETESKSGYYAAFRARLVKLRLDLDYSQDQMATALGMSKANYEKYEYRSKFPLHKVPQLALITHESLEFILTGKNSRRPTVRAVR